MNKYILSCESTVDLKKDYLDKRDIKYVYSHYEVDGVAYPDDMEESMTFKDFYSKLRNGSDTKTFQINYQEFYNYFKTLLNEGKDIIHICLSSGLTSVINSARLAKESLEDDFPDQKIYLIDSLSASIGSGLILDKMADLRDEGYSIEDLYDWTEKNKLRARAWFCTDDLSFFIKGGRISKTAGIVGGLLNVCPLMTVTSEGKLEVVQKVRGKKKVMMTLIEKMKEEAEDGLDYEDRLYIGHADAEEDAEILKSMVQETFNKEIKIDTNFIGTTIGSHTGPGMLALCYWGK